MDSTHSYNESASLPCHVSLSSPPVAPPPSPLHEEALAEEQLNESEKMKWRGRSNFARLADELSSSLATIAREERRKVQYQRGDESARSSFGAGRESRGESEHGGNASEESWLSFLGTQSAPGPSLVTANTSSGSDDLYSSNGGGKSNDGGATQQHQRFLPDGLAGPPSDDHGLPKPVDDRVGRAHHNSHASVIASLPPPQLKSGGGGSSSSSLRSESSCDKSHVKRAPPEIDEVDHFIMETLLSKPKKRRAMYYRDDDVESSSSSGSDGGYDASSSDNRVPRSSCSSPSVSSSEDGQDQPRRREFIVRLRHGRRHSRRCHSVESSASLSSQPVDLSSSSAARLSDSGSGSSSKQIGKTQRKRTHDAASAPGASVVIPSVSDTIGATNKMLMAVTRRHQQGGTLFSVARYRLKSMQPLDEEAPIFSLSTDMMAQCMSYLDPTEVHSLLTVPLSKQWRDTYTASQDLWRVLCLMEPFKAKFAPEDDDSDIDSIDSLQSDPELKHVFGKYRLLYTSFIRCLRYLTQIKDDAIHGRPSPSVVDYGGGEQNGFQLTSNSGLRRFLAKARDAVGNSRQRSILAAAANPNTPVELSNDDRSFDGEPMRKKPKTESKEANNGVRYGHSKLTQRLLGPSKCGAPGNVELPWSCAIYSIVNWMAAFSDVEGIQTMCLKVLPSLLEDEGQRTTAQNAGLTDIVLRAMVVFPDSAELHTAAFHTIVLLARPLGGREGMLFHSSMVNSSGIFNTGSRNGKSGIAVMLDSMQRFQTEDILQAMSCWSLVNIALAPSQKSVLVKLGGIQATTNAMMQHPYNAEVQFRSLFALINLVIPSVAPPDESTEGRAMQEQLGDVNQTVEKDVLDENVAQIANLVVTAMKHFCSSESILNRACLVLHNLSLSPDYHATLLWTKGCYQMLEWCLANYPSDQVLQQSAAGTLHRLQQTMSNNEELRQQFTHFLQSQQQHSLEEARREAMLLQEQETLLSSQQADT